MALLRFTARTLLALPFIVDGVDAVRHPDTHGKKFRKSLKSLKNLDLPKVDKEQAEILARVAGGVSVLAAGAFAAGKAPRTCAAVLACTAVPIALIQNPVWTTSDQTQRNLYRRGLERYGAVIGGLLFASLDRKGAPSTRWRLRNWREQRSA